MNMKADLWFRPPPSFLRWKLLECSFQELSSCGLSERCWPEGFSPASPLHLPIAPPQALIGGGQVVVLLKKRSPCSQQPAQSGHFPCPPSLPVLSGFLLLADVFSHLSLPASPCCCGEEDSALRSCCRCMTGIAAVILIIVLRTFKVFFFFFF